MKVFIEAERNSTVRTRYNELSHELLEKFVVSRPYPFAYGFIRGTGASTRDALDCFVITKKQIRIGESIECEPIGAFIQHENEEEDIKIIAVDYEDQPGYDMEKCVDEIQEFIVEIFKDSPDINIWFGSLMRKEKAIEIIKEAQSIGRAQTSASI